MSYEGITVLQRKKNLEYIQEIDGKWYYLDAVLTYSMPYNDYQAAKAGLLKYFKDYEDEKELKTIT